MSDFFPVGYFPSGYFGRYFGGGDGAALHAAGIASGEAFGASALLNLNELLPLPALAHLRTRVLVAPRGRDVEVASVDVGVAPGVASLRVRATVAGLGSCEVGASRALLAVVTVGIECAEAFGVPAVRAVESFAEYPPEIAAMLREVSKIKRLTRLTRESRLTREPRLRRVGGGGW